MAPKTITQFSRDNLEAVRSEMEKALATALAGMGLGAKLGRISFSDHAFSVKVEVQTVGEDGRATESREASAFKANADWMVGLHPDMLGREFTNRGKRYRVTGLRTRARKYPVQCECLQDGKSYGFPTDVMAKKFPDLKANEGLPTLTLENDLLDGLARSK